MKNLVYLLIVGSLIGTYYSVAPGITYADFMCLLLLLISIIKYIQKQWVIDRFCKLSALYIPFMLFSAIINAEISNTVFINYFRNYLWGIVVYFALSNNIHCIKDIKKILLFGVAFMVIFLINYKSMMQETYYTNLATLDFGYGRNNVAFTALLFSIVFEFLYYTRLVKSYILLGIVVMTTIIVFCTSRFSMMMLIISFVIFRLFSYKKISISELITIICFVALGPIVYKIIITHIDSSFYAMSQNYLNEKINGAGDDFMNSRIMSINIDPIMHMLNFESLDFLLIGRPLYIQHSFLSHTLITTGIGGFLCYIISNIKLLKWTFKYKGDYLFLFIVVMVMFTNDFITNARFIIGVNSIFYGAICAIIYRYIIVNENSNIPKRVYR